MSKKLPAGWPAHLYSKAAMLERHEQRLAGVINAPLSRCTREQWMASLTAKAKACKPVRQIAPLEAQSSHPKP